MDAISCNCEVIIRDVLRTRGIASLREAHQENVLETKIIRKAAPSVVRSESCSRNKSLTNNQTCIEYCWPDPKLPMYEGEPRLHFCHLEDEFWCQSNDVSGELQRKIQGAVKGPSVIGGRRRGSENDSFNASPNWRDERSTLEINIANDPWLHTPYGSIWKLLARGVCRRPEQACQ